MKVIEIVRYGAPEEACDCVEAPDLPAPGAGEIVADVEAFPLNPADLHTLAGNYAVRPPLPARLGAEAVGRISAVGPDVAGLAVGDRVIFRCRENWASRRHVKAGDVLRLPAALQGDVPADLVLQAAMLKVNPATALLMLRNYVTPAAGEWVIQNAANSAVGTHLARMAAAEGWRTINVVRSDAAAEVVRAAGGDAVVRDGPDLAAAVAKVAGGARIALGIDALAGAHTGRLADCLSDGATLVNYGRLTDKECHVEARHFIYRGLALTGFWLSPALVRIGPAATAALYADLAGRIASGALRAPVEATYPIERIREAVAHAHRGGRAGKILVTPNGPL
ncbi:MAG: zinc-dependent alcohol dehydrogenase family protein [Hyphomicrobiaceae bacterium]